MPATLQAVGAGLVRLADSPCDAELGGDAVEPAEEVGSGAASRHLLDVEHPAAAEQRGGDGLELRRRGGELVPGAEHRLDEVGHVVAAAEATCGGAGRTPPEEAPASGGEVEEIDIPVIDLAAFLRGGGALPAGVAEACKRHGFFQVANHGVDPSLLAEAYRCLDAFYARPLAEKQRAQRRPGESYGYASSFTGRFDCKLPWKETLSFHHSAAPGGERAVVDYFVAVLGEEYRHMGEVYQEYSDVMTRLALDVTEVLAAALGLDDRAALRGFFSGSDSVMRRRRRPAGARRRRVARAVRPRADAFVVNIGDTFAALTDGRHASCLHRAVVNSAAARRSLTFFLNPQLDRVVRPPPALLAADPDRPRAFPDFTWREFLEFTQKRYRSNENTLEAFVAWIKAGRGKGPEEK
ncbi:hypothetical protein EJB05_15121, partial [Eragrostis curvula]